MDYQKISGKLFKNFVVAMIYFSLSLRLFAQDSENQERPNFIFIYTDDQRFDCLGIVQEEQGEKGRFPWLETPNLDKMAEEGIMFKNAFVVHSLSTPSRASFLTGQYTHEHKIFTNFTPFPATMEHWGSKLTDNGYQTAYIGKWHMGDQSGQRPGFSYSASYLGQGIFFDCPFEINGKKTETQGWVDDVSTDYAINFIKKNQNKNFAVAIGYKSAHVPFLPPPRDESIYTSGEKMGPAQNHTDIPIYLGRVHEAKREHLKPYGNVLTEDYINYFRTLTTIDENVGKLMDFLEKEGLDQNTMIIYTSDNGYHFGEHGIGDKRSAYEVSMRIPMLVSYPKSQLNGKVFDDMVLNIDVAPTILDLAGVPIPEQMQGKSWKPLLERTTASIRDQFLYEYFFSYTDITDYEIQTVNPPITPTIVALRTNTAKLITYPGRDWVELFNLENDPYERTNLAGNPKYDALLNEMKQRLENEKNRMNFEIPEDAKYVPDDDLEDWRK